MSSPEHAGSATEPRHPVRDQRLLVGLDVDGTLVHHDGTLSPRVVEVVRRLDELPHVEVVIATGRAVEATLPVMERLGLLTRPVEEERAVEEQSIATMRQALVDRGFLEPGAGVPSVMEAMHRWLGQTPSALRAISLADVVGDHRAINQPGTDDEYPNWRLPLTGPDGALVSLEDATRAELAEVLFRSASGH